MGHVHAFLTRWLSLGAIWAGGQGQGVIADLNSDYR